MGSSVPVCCVFLDAGMTTREGEASRPVLPCSRDSRAPESGPSEASSEQCSRSGSSENLDHCSQSPGCCFHSASFSGCRRSWWWTHRNEGGELFCTQAGSVCSKALRTSAWDEADSLRPPSPSKGECSPAAQEGRFLTSIGSYKNGCVCTFIY